LGGRVKVKKKTLYSIEKGTQGSEEKKKIKTRGVKPRKEGGHTIRKASL